jgi:deferrochelatase/peroxidase EfeB
MLRALQERGEVRDLDATRPGENAATVPAHDFNVLLGYGARFFDTAVHDPPLSTAERPAYLAPLSPDHPAFATIPWAAGANDAVSGEGDLCLQFTGLSASGIARPSVELWKLITDRDLPLEIQGSHEGFQRDDGRSWIDFHDGLSNIESSQRLFALAADPDPEWMAGGTYMAFLRLHTDLAAWRVLSREAQEIIVGRDKLTGVPLEHVERIGDALTPRALAGCVPGKPAYLDPPQSGDPLVEASHIHRANQNRAQPTSAASQRIFRQGYDFLEAVGPDGPRLGLNFVGFQKDLARLQHVLSTSGWLGDVNFGGPSTPQAGEPDPIVLIRLIAGGFYAVPPRAEPFAGAELLTTGADSDS